MKTLEEKVKELTLTESWFPHCTDPVERFECAKIYRNNNYELAWQKISDLEHLSPKARAEAKSRYVSTRDAREENIALKKEENEKTQFIASLPVFHTYRSLPSNYATKNMIKNNDRTLHDGALPVATISFWHKSHLVYNLEDTDKNKMIRKSANDKNYRSRHWWKEHGRIVKPKARTNFYSSWHFQGCGTQTYEVFSLAQTRPFIDK